MHAQLFVKMDLTTDACRYILAPFWPPPPQWAFHGPTGNFSLTSRVVILSLYSSRAKLLPLALCLECLGENIASSKHNFSWQTPAVQPGPIYLLPQSWARTPFNTWPQYAPTQMGNLNDTSQLWVAMLTCTLSPTAFVISGYSSSPRVWFLEYMAIGPLGRIKEKYHMHLGLPRWC